MKNRNSDTLSAAARRPTRKAVGIRSPTLMLRRILVPLDFSGKSRQALEFAVPLAEAYGGKIFLVHVVEPAYAYPYHPSEMGIATVIPRSVVETCKEKLTTLARELVPPRLLGQTLVRDGRAYDEIVDAADELKADLIALSTHGHTGLKHVFLGSTAERVVRHARCPVLTVRRH